MQLGNPRYHRENNPKGFQATTGGKGNGGGGGGGVGRHCGEKAYSGLKFDANLYLHRLSYQQNRYYTVVTVCEEENLESCSRFYRRWWCQEAMCVCMCVYVRAWPTD